MLTKKGFLKICAGGLLFLAGLLGGLFSLIVFLWNVVVFGQPTWHGLTMILGLIVCAAGYRIVEKA